MVVLKWGIRNIDIIFQSFILGTLKIYDNMVEQKRIEFIDLAKGICILLVVMLHVGGPTISIPGLELVRMPLYFILSGLFYKDYGNGKNLFVKKTNKLLVPFLFFYVCSYLIYFSFGYVLNFIRPNTMNITCSIFDIFVQRKLLNYPIWFLLALFWCNMLFYIINKIIKNNMLKIITIFVIALFGVYLGKMKIFIPFYIDISFSALPFFCVGYYLKATDILIKNKYDKYNILISFVLWISSYIAFRCFKPEMDYFNNNISGFDAYVIAFISVLAVLFLCKKIKQIPILSYMGRYSIVVLCVHAIIAIPLFKIETVLFNSLEHSWVVNTIILVLLSLCCIPVFLKYIPQFIAQKDIFKI